MAGSKRKMAPPSSEEMAAISEKHAAVLDAFDSFEGETIVKELAGTWKKEVGAIICGTISHAYEFVPKAKPGEEKKAPVPGIALILTAPCNGKRDGARDSFDVGELVGVTLDRKLEPILLYEAGSKVCIRIDGEKDLDNGGRTWRSSVKIVGNKRRGAHPLKPLTVEAEDEPSDADETGAPEVEVSDEDFIG